MDLSIRISIFHLKHVFYLKFGSILVWKLNLNLDAKAELKLGLSCENWAWIWVQKLNLNLNRSHKPEFGFQYKTWIWSRKLKVEVKRFNNLVYNRPIYSNNEIHNNFHYFHILFCIIIFKTENFFLLWFDHNNLQTLTKYFLSNLVNSY